MKGGKERTMLSKKQSKEFLRICKDVDFLKINPVCKDSNISSSAIYRFINTDDYDDMISEKKVAGVSEQLYNCCLFIVDVYKDIEKKAA